MQSNGLHSSAFPFSYLRPDSPPGSSGGFSGTQHHHPSHTGFLKATEYRGRRTIKYTPSFGGEDGGGGDALRSIQRELECRMSRTGTGGLPLRTADSGDQENRKWNYRANTGNEQLKTEDHNRNEIQAKTAYERRLPRGQGHVTGQGHRVSGRGHVFHTDASGSFRKRHSDVDSGCHSDASEAPNLGADDDVCLVLPLSPCEHPGLFDNFVLRTKFTAEAHAHSAGEFLRLPVSQNPAGGCPRKSSPQTGNCAQKGSHGYDHKGIHSYYQNGHHGYDQNGYHGYDHHHSNAGNYHHGNRPETTGVPDKRKPTETNNLGFCTDAGSHVTQSKKPRMYLPPPPAISAPSFAYGNGGHRTGHVTDPSKPKNEGGGGGRNRTLIVVLLLLVFVLLVGFGAGFAAAWFGRQGAHS